MTAAPLISVLLPVYNAEPYVAAAMQSILRQRSRISSDLSVDPSS
ncbi:MAG: glycosyltransferase family 2 protein, partial [Mesorhizobium sp.]